MHGEKGGGVEVSLGATAHPPGARSFGCMLGAFQDRLGTEVCLARPFLHCSYSPTAKRASKLTSLATVVRINQMMSVKWEAP